ncbi:MAG TPA: hypothetical protein VIQ78_00665 [Terrimesophilobacter sp.]|uniref:hypothetical protein n=1 Tax=Terrimesophilobacter sp. TaxID=2906435 RepID=UPI002F9239AF
MAAVSEQKVSDERLRAATGRVRAEWHALLDAAGAAGWTHPEIARWLYETQGVDGWWAQGITVGYEQAHGRRLPGQQADGTFSVTVTKTIAAPRAAVVDAALAALIRQLGQPDSLKPESLYATARWKINGETIVAGLSEPRPESTLVSLGRSRITDGEMLGSAKDQLREALQAVSEALA